MKSICFAAIAALCLLSSSAFAAGSLDDGGAVLNFSDGRPSARRIEDINAILRSVGVHLSRTPLPARATPLLAASAHAPLTDVQQRELLAIFALSRRDVLEQIRLAGRQPVLPRGGHLATRESGVPPYPKVYDLKAMSASDRVSARNKFARLHVNATNEGVGVDEVMTLVAGGPWTWYFLLADDVVGELQMARVAPGGPGWRLSYPGLTPHGGYFHANDGLVVAYITGPEEWQMRYRAPSLPGAAMLGKNPWIDFSAKQ
jgi:hypothetical protein